MPRRPPASRLARLALEARYRTEAAGVGGLSVLARLAPPAVRAALGTGLGTLVWAVDARHRHVARDNVQLAYGDALTPREARRLVLASMRHLGRLAAEMLALSAGHGQELDARVHIEGFEHLRDALSRGNGVIGFTGHLGNWELPPLVFGHLGAPISPIARPLDNPYLEERLARLRKLTGNRIIHRRGAPREALALLRAGGFLGILIDQRPKRGGIRVRFFGTEAHTTDALARLALHSDAAIVPIYAVQEPGGFWRMVVEPAVPVVRTGDLEADTHRITADCTAILEGWIRRYPEQWLWAHRRWEAPSSHVPAGRTKRESGNQ